MGNLIEDLLQKQRDWLRSLKIDVEVLLPGDVSCFTCCSSPLHFLCRNCQVQLNLQRLHSAPGATAAATTAAAMLLSILTDYRIANNPLGL